MHSTSPETRSRAALLVLIVLQAVMLAALFAQIAPHPPRAVAPFALGPFLGASIAIAGAAIVLGAVRTGLGTAVSLAAGVLALISFGPQKWLDPAIGEIWPAVLIAELAVAVLVVETLRARSARGAG